MMSINVSHFFCISQQYEYSDTVNTRMVLMFSALHYEFYNLTKRIFPKGQLTFLYSKVSQYQEFLMLKSEPYIKDFSNSLNS